LRGNSKPIAALDQLSGGPGTNVDHRGAAG
jgi:hypothetical protein